MAVCKEARTMVVVGDGPSHSASGDAAGQRLSFSVWKLAEQAILRDTTLKLVAASGPPNSPGASGRSPAGLERLTRNLS